MRIRFDEHAALFLGLSYFRGRVALYALLKALGVEKGDEVLLQAFTCVANPEAIIAAGATPVYVDIEDDGVNMDWQDLKKKITGKTKAVVVQHTFGIPANIEFLLSVTTENNIPVIEDCCHTLESRYQEKKVGNFGIGSYYSFEWGKPLVAGIGGTLKINDHSLENVLENNRSKYSYPSFRSEIRLAGQYLAHKILYRPRFYWPVRSLFHAMGKIGVVKSNYNPLIDGHVAEDFSLRMSRFARVTLLSKIAHINSITRHSVAVSKVYSSQIDNPQIRHIAPPKRSFTVYCRYPVLADNKQCLLKKAKKVKVELAEWYTSPVHPLNNDELGLVKYQKGSCKNAETRCQQIVTFPTHLLVDRKIMNRAINFINNVT